MEDKRGKGTRLFRLLPWLAGVALTLLFLLGVANLLAPRAVQRLLVGGLAPTPAPDAHLPRAAIVDQTGLSFPTPEFLSQAEAYLEEAGYAVDRYPPGEVTVEFLRDLPSKGYALILFQTHLTNNRVDSDAPPGPYLFTNELYQEDSYRRLQAANQVGPVRFFFEDSISLFAVSPQFIRESMRGDFLDTIIILGGCQSLEVPHLARAFLDRGASVVIGWDDMVDLWHNNRALAHLLEGMAVEGLSPQEAVNATKAEIGPDPEYGASLDLLE